MRTTTARRFRFAVNTIRGARKSRLRLSSTSGQLAAAWLAVALVVVQGAHASVIEYQYAGVITSADPSTGVAPGTAFQGTFAYDSSLKRPELSMEGTNQFLSGQSLGRPGSTADGSGLTLNVAGQPVYSNHMGLEVGVSEVDGKYGYQAPPNTAVSLSNGNIGDSSTSVALNLKNPGRDVFSSLLPPASLSLADFPDAQLIVVANAGSPQHKTLYQGTINMLAPIGTPQPVPEPALATCLCLAAAGLLARHRGSRKD